MTGVCILKAEVNSLGLHLTIRMNRDLESRRPDLVRHFTDIDEVVQAIRQFLLEYERTTVR